MGDVFDEEEDRLMIDDAVDASKDWTGSQRLHNTDCKEEGELDDDEESSHATTQVHCTILNGTSNGMQSDCVETLKCSSSNSSESLLRPSDIASACSSKKGKKKRTAQQVQPSASTSCIPEAAKRTKQFKNRDKACNVSTRAMQTTENDVDVSLGSTHCLDFTVLAKVPGPTSDSLYFVTNWNGRELYGILGDGMPSLHQSFQHKSGNSNGDLAADSNSIAHDRNAWATPPKKKSQRGNRTSSCASSESKHSKKGTDLLDLHDEDTSQSPVSWLCAGGTDPLYGVGTTAIGTTTGLAQLRERVPLLSCPVSGCGYRFETTAQLCLHHSHHIKHQLAIYTESMGSQTDKSTYQDAACEPIAELNKDQLRPQLSNSEERSITELFQVAHRKDNRPLTKPTALDALERMGAGLLSESVHDSKSSMLPLAGSPVFSDLSDDAPTLEKEVVDKTETMHKTIVHKAALSVSSSSDKLCTDTAIASCSAPPSTSSEVLLNRAMLLSTVKQEDNKHSPALHSPRVSPAVNNVKPHPAPAPVSRPVSFLMGQSSSIQQRNDMLQQQHAHYMMQQQQQQMQLQMQMRLGAFVLPSANPAMAQQAYEQLVAMQTGISPANFGLFAPQAFQPK